MNSPFDPEPEAIPPGWYPTPDGSQHYWDGRAWLALPAPDAPASATKKKILFGAIGVLVAAGITAGALTAKSAHDDNVRSAAIASSSSVSAASSSRAAASSAAAAASAANTERYLRESSVSEIESSIKKLAQDHANSGFIDGPVLGVSCDPVAGGSTDDLTARTTVFECFVATQRLAGGESRGYKYHATMNWSTGNYTYGFGAP